MILGFGNNVVSALAADITAEQKTIQVMPGTGEMFANLLTTDISNPDSPHGVYGKLTITDSKQTVVEICHLLSVIQDTLTVLRGQEGTTAKGWSLNDVIANFATRGSEQSFVQIEQLQAGDYTSAKAGGTANALLISLPSTFFNNASTDWQLNTPILITPACTNTGAATLQVVVAGKVAGTYPLVKGTETPLQAGDIVAHSPFVAIFNAEQGRFLVLNPTTEIGVVRSVNGVEPGSDGDVDLPRYGLGVGPQHKDDAYNNIGQIYRVNSSSTSTPGGSVYGVISLPCDGAPSASYLALGNNGEAWVGRSTTPAAGVKWVRIFTTAYKPTPGDINAVAKTGDTMTGALTTPFVATTPDVMPEGAGAYTDQLDHKALFYQANWQWPVNTGGIFVPIAKGTSTRKDVGYPAAVSFGYLMPENNEHAHPTIHVKGDSNVDCAWDFNPYTGKISSKAGTFVTESWCPFPVGYVMLLGNASDPNALYPGTQWQDLNGTGYDGRVISLGYDAMAIGGSNQVTIFADNLPDHSHKSGWGAPGAPYADDLITGTDNTGNYNRSMTTETFTDSSGSVRVTNAPLNVTNAYVHVRGWMRTA